MSVAAPPQEAFELSESISLAIEEGATSIFDPEGCVPVHIIRPGVGKGRGKHLYEAKMLQENAHKFANWRMYVDHQSPEARRAAGGLPRSVRDLGGRIVESKWDPSVPADPARGFGQGAVVGRAKPAPFVRDLIESDPALIEASISASATGVRPVNHPGHGRVWMVEGINDRGSVDWVTEAGAGGRVAPLLEAAYSSEEDVEMALLEAMSDEEFRAYASEARPHLKIEEATPPAGSASPRETTLIESEEDDMPLTAEALREALSENPEVLVEALQGTNLQEVIDARVNARVEEAITAERATAEAERDAVINRRIELRDMRDVAQQMIAEARIPDEWKPSLERRFQLQEGHSPTAELDVVDEVDDKGAVTKSALARLREAVQEAIDEEQAKLAVVRPTRVRNQGPTTLSEGASEPGSETQATSSAQQEKPYWQTLLEEAGIDPEKAYAA